MESNHLSPAACDDARVSEERGHRNELPKLKNRLTDIFQTDLPSSLAIVSNENRELIFCCNANTMGALQSSRWQCDKYWWENLV